MGSTMTAKLLARASGQDHVRSGDTVLVKIDLLSCVDAGPFIDELRTRNLKVWNPEKVIFCFDHFFQPEWMPIRSEIEHPRIKAFAREQGIPSENIYDVGRNGISHQIPVEKGWALPGAVCLGVDTQSSTMGAVNCFAMPVLNGAEPPLITGDIWMIVPESVRINLVGRLPPGVTGKDVVYRLIADLGEAVQGKVLEFCGPGVASLSMDMRLAIANGSVQIGALTIIFPADALLIDYVTPRARTPFHPVAPDEDAEYETSYDFDLSTLGRLVAGPHEINLVRPLDQLTSLDVTAAYIGSCSGGRLEDLALAANILRGRKLHPAVRLIVTPISADTHREMARTGILQDILDAGATVTQPGCGACYKGNLSPLKLGEGERCISTSVETLRGRMGSMKAEILLANAAVVAASALEGRVADPALYLALGEGAHG